ncbi:hypothetical protein, partial [Nonomuraea jabiensis]|uniref:hypothetical protein n=1 Tax=Nonomuraea jabiensis TaxID=882448 RepID=UPI0036B517D5
SPRASARPRWSPGSPAACPPWWGALCGATSGAAAVPDAWRRHVDEIAGVLVPGLKGLSLTALAGRLPGAAEADVHGTG